MADSTVENLTDIATASGLQTTDLLYVFRPGAPDLDFRADGADIVAVVESNATAFAAASHNHTLSDVTDSGALAALDTVATAQIDNDAVSYAKIQNISAADRVLGRSTAGAGDVEEIICTAAGRALLDDADAAAQRTTLGVVYATEAEVFTGTETGKVISPAELKPKEAIVIAASDETTDLTTGTAKVTFRMPYAFEIADVRASVTTAPTGSALTVDINEGGTSILSTKLTIDATEKTSESAATAAVVSDSTLADDAEITIDIDAIGSTVAGKGLKVTLIGNRT